MFFKNKKLVITAIIVVIGFVIVYFSAANRNNTKVLDSALGIVVKPVGGFVGGIAEKTSGFFGYFKNKKNLIKQSSDMEKKMLKLEKENSTLKAYETENERLREMLDFKEKNPEFELVAAGVTSKDNSNYYSGFTIDVGTKNGIGKNMAVVGSKGLIGYVDEAGANFAKVRTVIDGGSSVGCVVSRTQSLAVTEGDINLMNSGLIKMMYVSKEMNIIKGDIIETSGMGQIYPKGIVIGRVEEIINLTGGESPYAIIQPVENFETIHEVFVITNVH